MNCQQWKVCDTKLWGVDHHYDRSLFQTGYAWFNIIPIMVMIMCYHLGGRVFPALSTINYHPTHGARKWPSVSKMNICLDIYLPLQSVHCTCTSGWLDISCNAICAKVKQSMLKPPPIIAPPLSYSWDIETWHLKAQKMIKPFYI